MQDTRALFNAALYRVLDVAPLYAAGDECLQDYSLSQCELEPLELPCDNEVMGFLAEVAWTAGGAARELHYLESDTREIVALLDRKIDRPD